mgnify:CR=1 FL=1
MVEKTLILLLLHKDNYLIQNVFLKVVDQWYISYFGDTPDSPEYREDALKIYYKAKSQVKEYVRKQKGA